MAIIIHTKSLSLSPPKALAANTRLKALERNLRSNCNISREERLGLSLFDLSSDSFIASINSRQAFQTGSMFKLCIGFLIVHKKPEWLLLKSGEEYQLILEMLNKSSNSATNALIKKLGGPKACQKLVQQYPTIFLNTKINSLIPKDGRQYQNLSSPDDFVRMLRQLWLSKDNASEELLKILNRTSRSRFQLKKPDGFSVSADLFNKTGSTSRVCCESAIILIPESKLKFILCAIIDRDVPVCSLEAWLPARERCLRTLAQESYSIIRDAQS